jgi:hypothetical protein
LAILNQNLMVEAALRSHVKGRAGLLPPGTSKLRPQAPPRRGRFSVSEAETANVSVAAWMAGPIVARPRRRGRQQAPGLLQGPQIAGRELGDLRGPRQTVAGAIEALESAAAHFPEQKSHRFAAFWTDGRRGVFGHDTHPGPAGAQHSQSPVDAEGGR